VATIEHGTMGNAASAEAMARHGAVLVPTFCAAAGVVREAEAGNLPPAIASQALQIGPLHRGAFRAALEAGVQIACGTDTGVPGTEFGENARELGYMVDHGLTAEQTLLAATRDAARVLGWSADTGTLEPGKSADLLLAEGDPLADVTLLADLSHLHLVVKAGEIAADRRPDKSIARPSRSRLPAD
jgi:imidazolonepropionase-like amidohydrolase